MGTGTFDAIINAVRSLPPMTDEEWNAFQTAMDESRAERRKLAAEGRDRMSRFMAMGCFGVEKDNLEDEIPPCRSQD